MKVKFFLDNGANIHSCRDTGWSDPVNDLGLEDGEWEQMSDDEKNEMAKDYMEQYIEMGYEESEV